MHDIKLTYAATFIKNLFLIGKTRDTLDEAAIGMVILRFGQILQLGQYHTNFFCHEMDCPVIDDATGKPVNILQKPLKLMSELIELYSAPGDWIFDGLGGLGECTLCFSNA